jgi:hypothetical protein
VGSTFPSGVGAIEAILAEVIFALFALDYCSFALAFLAHRNTSWLPDDIDLILLLADVT